MLCFAIAYFYASELLAPVVVPGQDSGGHGHGAKLTMDGAVTDGTNALCSALMAVSALLGGLLFTYAAPPPQPEAAPTPPSLLLGGGSGAPSCGYLGAAPGGPLGSTD